jgi:hypothetical protein
MNEYLKVIYEEIIIEGKHSISLTKLDDKAVLRIVAISPTDSETLMNTITYVKEKARLVAEKGLES